MRRLFLILACWWCAVATAADGREFVVVALHDVVDTARELQSDAVTADRLVAFFDYLAGNGYTAISLDDIERARSGGRPLPAKAVLLTVDDGYRSLYTRIFPLALAYRMPVLAALVSSWMDTPPTGTVRYGEQDVPRSRFITWDQAREMQASGWVEFASHSHALHEQVVGNPQGNLMPTAVTRRWDARQGYESTPAWRERVSADLRRAHERLTSELGRPPRSIIWPYGRYTADGVEAALALGFRYAFTLESAPAFADRSGAIPRLSVQDDPMLGVLVRAMTFRDLWPEARRLVCVDPAAYASSDPEETNARLGHAIERLVRLGATDVVIDAAAWGEGGSAAASWFPTRELATRADLLSRLATQMRVRAGVGVVVRLPHARALAALGDSAKVMRLFEDLAAHVPFDALLIEDAPSLGTTASPAAAQAPAAWAVAAARQAHDIATWPASDALAWSAFHAAQRLRPGLQLVWMAESGWPLQAPAPLADLTLVPGGVGDTGVPAPPLRPPASRRVGVWWASQAPPAAPAVIPATLRLQAAGVTGFGWCPDDALADLPAAREVAPAWSAKSFPLPGAKP